MKTETDKNMIVAGIRGAQAARAGFCAVLAAAMLAAGCAKEPLPDAGGVPDGGGVAVTLNLTPEALSMPVAEDAAAAVPAGVAVPGVAAPAASGVIAADDGGAMSLQLLAQPAAPATRATAAELAVENVWVLQFDGTAAASKLIRKRYLENYAAGLPLELLPGSSQRIVVLANSYDAALGDGLVLFTTTYADVQAMTGPASDALNANPCIPMSGTITATVAENTPLAISLKSIVAKVTFQVKVGRGMSTTGWSIQPLDLAPACWLPDTGSGVWPAADKLTGGALAATTGVTLSATDYTTFTWYLPANRRGSVSGTTPVLRRTNAPAGATCIKLSNKTASGNIVARNYYIHLGANFTTDYNLQLHTHYSYLTTLQADEGGDSRVEAVVKVQANCAMTIPGAGIAFDVGNRMDNSSSMDPLIAPAAVLTWRLGLPYTPLLIWQDTKGLISGVSYDESSGYLTVSTNAAAGIAGGNAVVGLFPLGTTDPAAGTCIWSWHVWVTDYKPDGTKDYSLVANSKADVPGGEVHTYGSQYIAKNPGKVMMDRNLGATKALYALVTTNAENYPTYGLFYQWGRKDPFPKAKLGRVADDRTDTSQDTYDASGGTTGYPTLQSRSVTVLEAVQNPQVFYAGSGDWSPSLTYTMWGDGGSKSRYDPCPEGWRIASGETWGDFAETVFTMNPAWIRDDDVNLAGCMYAEENVATFYPAPGIRSPDGTLSYVGYQGTMWSSVNDAGFPNCLIYNNSGVTINYAGAYGTACGNQVRCIQE